MNLGAPKAGNLGRLQRELDDLDEHGIRNLRIMGSTQGPDDKSRRIVPSLEPQKGQYNNDIWEGLDTLLVEMRKRNMRAVVTLNNFWEWSGGFGQINEWYNGSFSSYPTNFYSDKKLTDHLKDFIKVIVNRTNSISKIKYKDDATIMAWQLANEPRAGSCTDWEKWIDETSSLIKSLAPKQLVSIGNEGTITSCSSGGNSIKNVDYITFHAWAQNWGWYTPVSRDGLEHGIKLAKNYINDNIHLNENLQKPMVLEEFGLARNGMSYDPDSKTDIRDDYFRAIFEHVFNIARDKGTISGTNFWAWGGEGRPKNRGGEWWTKNDPFTGDPPHERQGWYSVYDKDQSTKTLIKTYTKLFDELR